MEVIQEIKKVETLIRYQGFIYQRYGFDDGSYDWYEDYYGGFEWISNSFPQLKEELETEYQKLIKDTEIKQSIDYKTKELEELYTKLFDKIEKLNLII